MKSVGEYFIWTVLKITMIGYAATLFACAVLVLFFSFYHGRAVTFEGDGTDFVIFLGKIFLGFLLTVTLSGLLPFLEERNEAKRKS